MAGIKRRLGSLRGPQGIPGYEAMQRRLVASDTLDTVDTTGTYYAPTGNHSVGLGLPEPGAGTLSVIRHGDLSGSAIFTSRGAQPKVWASTITDGAGTWSDWVEIGERILKRRLLRSDTLSDLETGSYIAMSGNEAAAIGVPSPSAGTLTLTRGLSSDGVTIGVGTAIFTVRGEDPAVWVSTVTDGAGTWSDWVEIGAEYIPEDPVTELHAFLVAGQSNMAGHGTPYSDELDPVDPRILQYGARRRTIEPATVPLDQHRATVGLSPATVFALEYLKNQPAHVGVLLIAAARGASYLKPRPAGDYVWLPGSAASDHYDLYQQSVDQTSEALAADDRAILKGILWHQGEGNAGDTESEYADYFATMLTQYRTDLNDSTLPIVVGNLVPEGLEYVPGRAPVDRAITTIPATHQYAGLAPSEHGWAKFGDDTHFSRSGVERLGHRYVHGYKVALENREDTRPTPPLDVTARRVHNGVHLSWVAPLCRVTEYQVERQDESGDWHTLTRDQPTSTREFVPGDTTAIRIRARHDTYQSTALTIEV